MRVSVSIFAILFLLSVFVHLGSAVGNSWTSGRLMPTARYNVGVAVVNGKIFAIGGHRTSLGIVGINEEYDPITDSWTMKNSIPTPRESFGIAVWQNKIYVFGGLAQSGMTDATQVYDPSTDSWATNKASLPTKRIYFSANVVGDKIYLIGGQTSPSNQILDVNEVYDPAADSWTPKSRLPTPISAYASAAVDGKIYILGGQQASGAADLNQVYDTATDTWNNKTVMPNSVEFAAAGATSGTNATKMIYVFGGTSSSNMIVDYCMGYDPKNDTWTLGTSMPTSRSNLAVGVLDDRLYAIGGISSYALGTNELYTPNGYVPEFPSFLAVPLFMTVTALVAIVCRKRFPKWSRNLNKEATLV